METGNQNHENHSQMNKLMNIWKQLKERILVWAEMFPNEPNT